MGKAVLMATSSLGRQARSDRFFKLKILMSKMTLAVPLEGLNNKRERDKSEFEKGKGRDEKGREEERRGGEIKERRKRWEAKEEARGQYTISLCSLRRYLARIPFLLAML